MQYKDYEDEEQGITIGQLFAVIFGRKITFFSVWAGVFLVAFLVLKFGIDSGNKYYYSDFYLIDSVEATEQYSDGQSINLHDIITLDNIKVIAEDAGVSEKVAENVYYSDQFIVKRVEDTMVVNEEKVKSVSYHIEVPTKPFKNSTQARKFIQGVANLPNMKQASILTSQYNSQFLNMYNDAKTFELQLTYLMNQYELLDNLYTSLIATYGDVFLEDDLKLSNLKVELEEYFKNHSFETYQEQLANGGYVKGLSGEKTIYESKISALKKEKGLNEAKLNELIAQRDTLINTASSLQTVELSEYNSKIIELTLAIEDLNSGINECKHKLENLEKYETDTDLQQEIRAFESGLNEFKTKLVSFTSDYDKAANYVSKNYSITYFESTSIAKITGGMGTLKVLAYPLAAGLLLAMIVNLCIDGKKLTGKYKLVPVTEIKQKNKEEDEKEEKKTA